VAKIYFLDKHLANQISAWEVVERPLSIVKELIENSIDAHSSYIKIEIKNAWIEEIIISDDWDGILREDLSISLLKYTSSKIRKLEDLYNLTSLWFRWEALAAISSVTNIKIISKTAWEEMASSIEIENEINKELSYCEWENGTKIIVKDLFYNTPARLNYLKKARTEYLKIYDFLNNISLSYPEIWFEFISDSKKIFKYWKNEDLRTRIYNIYSDDFYSKLIEVDFHIYWMHITWYISSPKTSFPNKNKQILFVNKRLINSNLIFKAIFDAYNRFIASSSYPAYILNLDIDPSLIDVNVHPRKQEIRFADEWNIFRSFYNMIYEKLKSDTLIDQNDINFNNYTNKKELIWDKISFNNIKDDNDIYSKKNDFFVSNNCKNQDIEIKEETKKYHIWSSVNKFSSYSPYRDLTINPDQTIFSWLEKTPIWRIIGQSFNSYIIIETESKIKIIDQHALAERIIYEKLLNKQNKINSQTLLYAESLKIDIKDLAILEDNKEIFFDIWFDFEILQSWNVIINAIPDFIKKENIVNIFSWIISDFWEYNFNKSKSLDEIRNKIYAYTACRSAIKFWNKLNLFEMNKLLNDSVLDYSSTCPHGRPVIFEIDLNELKTKYKR